jgi:hypothetical protein
MIAGAGDRIAGDRVVAADGLRGAELMIIQSEVS